VPATLNAAIREFLDGLAELIGEEMLRRQVEAQDGSLTRACDHAQTERAHTEQPSPRVGNGEVTPNF